MTALLRVADLTVRFGRVEALRGVSLDVAPGSIVGLVGPNGAGKTTLIDAVAGFVAPASGRITFNGADLAGLPPHRRVRLGVSRTFQSLALFEDLTVEENLQVAAERGLRRNDRAESRARVQSAIELACLESSLDRLPEALTHAERKQLALARALATKPRLVMLDEPAAGLDAGERQRLAARLRTIAHEGTSVVLVDHDLALVLGVCSRVCVLDFGRVIADGPPEAVENDGRVRSAYLGVEPEHSPPEPPGNGRGETLVEVRGLVAGYGGSPVVNGVDLSIAAGEVVALVGPNGAGKTTTLSAIAGAIPVMGGSVRVLGGPIDGRADVAARRGVAYVAQDRSVISSLTVVENVRLAARGRRSAALRGLEDFPALEPLAERRAGLLSGGEQHLLALARALVRRPRLVLVDEVSLGLGPATARDVLSRLRKDARQRGTAVVVAEQHPGLALQAADRVVVLDRGQVGFAGTPAELAARPEVLGAVYLGT